MEESKFHIKPNVEEESSVLRESRPECDFGVVVNTKLEFVIQQLEKLNGRMWRLVWTLVGISMVAVISRFFTF